MADPTQPEQQKIDSTRPGPITTNNASQLFALSLPNLKQEKIAFQPSKQLFFLSFSFFC